MYHDNYFHHHCHYGNGGSTQEAPAHPWDRPGSGSTPCAHQICRRLAPREVVYIAYDATGCTSRVETCAYR